MSGSAPPPLEFDDVLADLGPGAAKEIASMLWSPTHDGLTVLELRNEVRRVRHQRKQAREAEAKRQGIINGYHRMNNEIAVAVKEGNHALALERAREQGVYIERHRQVLAPLLEASKPRSNI